MICNSMSSEVVKNNVNGGCSYIFEILLDSIAIANVKPGSSRPATQQKLSIGASFVRLESFKKGESFVPGESH